MCQTTIMSVARLLAWNTGVQIVGKVVSTIIGIFIVAIITRHLGQEGFGKYSTANAFLQFFAIILDFGLNVMIVQMLGESAGDEEAEQRIVSATFTLRTVTALILLSAAPIIALLFPYPSDLKIAIFALWASFFTAALNQIVVGVQQRHFKMHIVAISEVAGRIFLLLGLCIALVFHWGLIPIVLIVSLGGTLNFLINFLVARRYASFAWNWDVPFWKMLLRRSWPIGVSILFNLIYFKADTLILGWYSTHQGGNLAEVGIYSAAYRVLEILTTLPFMYAGVLLPLIAKAWKQEDRSGFSTLLSHSYNAMVLLAAPLMAGIFMLAQRSMVLVAGKDFAISGNVLRVLIIAVGIIFFGTVSSYAIVALDAQRKMLPIYIITAIVTLLGYSIFIPRYGMWAAAWLTVFSEGCVALAATIMSLILSKTRWNPIVALKAIGSALCMMLVLAWCEELNLGLLILIGAVTYSVLILLSGAVSRQMLKDIFIIKLT